MKSLVLLVIVCAFAILTEAAVSREGPNPQRKPNGCYNEKLGHLVYNEKKRIPGECAQAECQEGGGMYYAGCGVAIISHEAKPGETCHQEKDLSLPYPDCCIPKILCVKA